MSSALGAATGPPYDGFHGAALAALVAAGIVGVAWLLFLVVRWFQWVPRLPRPGPETSELGPEPPALANMLVNSWSVTAAAVPATLVDLAARRIAQLEEVGPDRFVVRTRAGADAPVLTAYERQVLRFVESRATGGSAPVEALRLGTDEGASWLAQFSGAVEKDAEARGLARRGWQRGELVALGAGLAVALGLLALALTLAHVGNARNGQRASEHDGAWFVLAAIAWIVAVGASSRIRSVRATPDGRAACARWLGVRAHLREDESFREQPPAGVVVWGRLLAYGVALGANRASTAALPIGPDDPDHAWSRATGSWRRVGVRYPHRFGAGDPPGAVLRDGLLKLVLWGAIAVVVVRVMGTVLWDAVNDAISNDGDLAVIGLFVLFLAIPSIGLVYVCGRVVDASIRVWRGAHDLRRTSVTEGPVVKIYGGSFAVDDGTAPELVAMKAPPGSMPGFGQRVEVRFTPALHHVQDVTVKEPTHGTVQAAAADRDVEHKDA